MTPFAALESSMNKQAFAGLLRGGASLLGKGLSRVGGKLQGMGLPRQIKAAPYKMDPPARLISRPGRGTAVPPAPPYSAGAGNIRSAAGQ